MFMSDSNVVPSVKWSSGYQLLYSNTILHCQLELFKKINLPMYIMCTGIKR